MYVMINIYYKALVLEAINRLAILKVYPTSERHCSPTSHSIPSVLIRPPQKYHRRQHLPGCSIHGAYGNAKENILDGRHAST